MAAHNLLCPLIILFSDCLYEFFMLPKGSFGLSLVIGEVCLPLNFEQIAAHIYKLLKNPVICCHRDCSVKIVIPVQTGASIFYILSHLIDSRLHTLQFLLISAKGRQAGRLYLKKQAYLQQLNNVIIVFKEHLREGGYDVIYGNFFDKGPAAYADLGFKIAHHLQSSQGFTD